MEANQKAETTKIMSPFEALLEIQRLQNNILLLVQQSQSLTVQIVKILCVTEEEETSNVEATEKEETK